MPKRAKEMGPLAVSRLTEPGMYVVGGAASLHLLIGGPKAKSWILRTMIGGKRRDLGLGSYPEFKSVAVWCWRAASRLRVTVQTPVEGS